MSGARRRSRLAVAIAGAALLVACGGGAPPLAPAPAPPPLHLDPLTDLAPAAGLGWLVHVRPRALASNPLVAPAIAALFPPEQADAYARANGGVRPVGLDALVVATYEGATLYLARGPIVPALLESAFKARAELDGRAEDRPWAITRLWGTAHGERQQLGIFGRDVVALETGRFGPLRAAALFAEGRLHKAKPALATTPLDRAADMLRHGESDPPARVFAPGPFEGAAARGVGGLLGACTAVAIGARPAPRPRSAAPSSGGALELTIVLTGAWGDDANAAGERLRVVFDTWSVTSLGRLTSLDHPLSEPSVESMRDALRLTVLLDALAVARGLRAATAAEVSEIMEQ